jgi:hypothetical protein
MGSTGQQLDEKVVVTFRPAGESSASCSMGATSGYAVANGADLHRRTAVVFEPESAAVDLTEIRQVGD